MVSNLHDVCCCADAEDVGEGSEIGRRWAYEDAHAKLDDASRTKRQRLVSSTSFLSHPSPIERKNSDLIPERNRPSAFEGLVELFKDPKVFTSPSAADNDASLTAIDFEEQSAGYQAAYSKLAGAENAPVDPVAYVTDVRDFVGKELERLVKAEPGVRGLMGSARAEVVEPFVVGMTGAGYGLT